MSDLYTKGYRIGRRDTEAKFSARYLEMETALRKIVKLIDVMPNRITLFDEIRNRARAALAPEQDK